MCSFQCVNIKMLDIITFGHRYHLKDPLNTRDLGIHTVHTLCYCLSANKHSYQSLNQLQVVFNELWNKLNLILMP